MTLPTSVFGRVGEEQIGKCIGDDTGQFLGHGAIPAAQAGFDVGDWNEALAAGKSTSRGRGHIADHQDQVGFFCCEIRIEFGDDIGRLLGLVAPGDIEVSVGRGQCEGFEEDIGK